MIELKVLYLLAAIAGAAGGIAAGRRRISRLLALTLCLVPVAGLGATIVFCGGHPLQGLGPSLILGGPPIAFGSAVGAARGGGSRWVLYSALVLAGSEMLLWSVCTFDLGSRVVAAVVHAGYGQGRRRRTRIRFR